MSFPAPRETPEQFAYTLGFMAGYWAVIESMLWFAVMVAFAVAICVWLFRF